MSIYSWCTKCSSRSNYCLAISDHRTDHFQWRADFTIGGSSGQRIRKLFPTRDLAKAYEGQMLTDFTRGQLFPFESKSKLLFSELVTEWYQKYALIRIKNPQAELYHCNTLTEFFGSMNITTLAYEHGEEFIRSSIRNGNRPGAVNRNLTTLQSIMNWAIRNSYLAKNPFSNLKKLKEDSARVRYLSKDEAIKLLYHCRRSDPCIVSVILFGLYTGFRRGNLERVTAQDVGNDFVTAAQTKSGHPYDVPISEELRCLLTTLPSSGVLLDTKNLDQRFREVVKAAGLWDGPRSPKTVTLHTLRHTFASWYLQNGGDIFRLQKMMGHSSIRMTERYSHLSVQNIREEAKHLNFGLPSSMSKAIELKVA